jgi:hypothetical protein
MSGFQPVKSWLDYRKKLRGGRKSSALDDIRPDVWTSDLTTELLELLWVLEATVSLIPALHRQLDDILNGPIFEESELPLPTEQDRRTPFLEDESTQNGLEL